MTRDNGRQSTRSQRNPRTGRQLAPVPSAPVNARSVLTEAFWNALGTLEAIAGSDAYSPADRLRAIDLMGKYGPGTVRGVSMDEVRDRLQRQRAALDELLPPDLVSTVHTRLREVRR